MHRELAFCVTLLSVAGPVLAVNKCVGPTGKVVYQDAACEGGKGEQLRIQPAVSTAPSGAAAGEAKARLDKLKADNQMSEAIRTHVPLIGMTAAQLQQAMGTPTKINAGNYSGTQHDQVIYERASETWYVYTRNGVVQSIQHRPGPPIGAAPASAARCPSQHEIKDAITSASSITLSERERAERWKVIRDMQACGK